MSGDITLGRIFGIPFRLHWSWFLAVFLISWTLAVGFFPSTLKPYEAGRNAYWGLGITAALGLFASVLLHELGHAVAAIWFGVPVRGIRLFVFGGVAELGSDPKKPGHEIVIALGGPLVTVGLVVVFGFIVRMIVAGGGVEWAVSEEGMLTLQGGTFLAAGSAAVFYYLGLINTIVLIFNMIPAFPLDGGRVLRGIIWAATGNYLTSTRVAAAIGIAFAWLLFAGGIFSAFGGNLLAGVWLFFLGTFLNNAAQSSIAYAQLQQLLRGVRVRELMRRHPMTIDAGLSLRRAASDYFLRHPYKAYPVVEDGRFLGILTLRAMQGEDPDAWDTLTAGELASRRALPAVHPDEPVLQALGKFGESGASRLAVVENGELVGLLCARDVMDWMEIRAGLAPPRDDES